MTSSQARKGASAEREVARMVTDMLGVPVQRRRNLGTHEDIGDLILRDTVIQVAAYTDLVRAVREKVPACVAQQERAGATFGATFLRRPGGAYVVVLTPEQWATYHREATA